MYTRIAMNVLAIAKRQQRAIYKAQLIGRRQLSCAIMQRAIDDATVKRAAHRREPLRAIPCPHAADIGHLHRRQAGFQRMVMIRDHIIPDHHHRAAAPITRPQPGIDIAPGLGTPQFPGHIAFLYRRKAISP